MSTNDERAKWIPVEEYAATSNMLPSELVSLILDGKLPGERHGDRWYVSAPLVRLVHPNGAGTPALLKIAACRLGCYVTAGRGELGIPLRFGDPGRPEALSALNVAIETTTRPDLPIEIFLNGEYFMIDSSLWVDIASALVKYQTLMDPSVEGLL